MDGCNFGELRLFPSARILVSLLIGHDRTYRKRAGNRRF
jgi:hypothetical protein